MTLLQKIQNLTWWTLDIKIKDILTDLFGRVEILEESGGGGTQDLQSVLDKGNVTTEPFYNEFDAGSGNYVRSGVIPVFGILDSGIPLPIVGQAVSIDGQLIEIGMLPDESNGGFIVHKTGAVNKKVIFAFPDKPNVSYPSHSLYTLATLDDIQAPLPTYADNAAAIVGGLETDKWYKTATGELRVVV